MAVSQFTDFIRATRNRYSKYVSDGILEDYVLFKELQKANGPPRRYSGVMGNEAGIISGVGGQDFEWRVFKARMASGRWGPATEISPSTPQILQHPKVSMGGYQVAYAIGTFETLSLDTEEEFVPLLKLYEQMATREWYMLFNEQAYKDNSASSPAGWGGLAAFVANTGTYATNITLSDTYAKPYVFDYSASGQSFAVTALDRFTEVVNNATHGDTQSGPDVPEVAFANRSDWQKMHSLISDLHRIVNVNEDMLKLGFKNFTYQGVRVYWDDEMTDQALKKVYILNMHSLGLVHAGKQLFMFDTGTTLEGILQVLNVGVHKGQMICTNTRKNGLIDNTESV